MACGSNMEGFRAITGSLEVAEKKLTKEEISSILLFATDLKGTSLACGNRKFLFRALQNVRNGQKRN